MDHGRKVSSNYNQSKEELSMELRRGPWTVDEDFTLINYVAHHGEGRWNSLARCAGLKRTGKSCRLRWLNYLRPDVRRGNITIEEQLLILELHSRWGNRWSKIAQQLPGRTDNEIKNYWRTRVQKHAKQLKCDVNSKQFKDTMRYLWMPRLVERIQAASGTTSAGSPTLPPPSAAASCHITQSYKNAELGPAQLLKQPVFSCGPANTAASSDSFGTPASDLTDCCYNNYPVNNSAVINQDCNYNHNQLVYGGDYQSSLTSPTGFFGPGMDFFDQSGLWTDGGEGADGLWNADDVWFLQQQLNGN